MASGNQNTLMIIDMHLDTGRIDPATRPEPLRAIRVRLWEGGRLIQTLTFRTPVPPESPYQFLRDIVLDLHYRRFMAARLTGVPEAPAAVHTVTGTLYRWQLAGETFFTEQPQPACLREKLSDRRLARLAVRRRRDSGPGTESAAGAAVVPVLLTLAEEGETALHDPRGPGGVLFRLGKRLPAAPDIQRTEKITEIRCRTYDLAAVGGILREVVGDSPILFLLGDVQELPPCRLSAQSARGFAEGAHIILPQLRWTAAGAAGWQLDHPTVATTWPDHGFIPPREILQPHPLVAAQLRFGSMSFCCHPDTWLRFLPFQRTPLHPHSHLAEQFTALLLHAARECAGFFYAPDIAVRFAVRGPRAAWLAWMTACRLATVAVRHGRGRRHHWEVHPEPSEIGSVAAASRDLSPRPPFLPRHMAAAVTAMRSLAGWSVPPCFPAPAEPMAAARYDLGTGETVIDTSVEAPRFVYSRIFMDEQPCGLVGMPLFVHPPDPAATGDRLQAEFFRWYADRWLRHQAQLEFDALQAESPPSAPGTSAGNPSIQVTRPPRLEVILATHHRPAEFRRVVESIRQQQLPVSLRVVDSNPPDSHTHEFCRAHHIPYQLSPPPGKSRAVNLGIRASTADILLFIDDDAVAHPEWSTQLHAGFCHPRVMCVTGLVMPLETSTPAHYYFETHMEEYEMGGLRRGYTEREFRRPYPFYRCSHAGTGACMAIRREAFDRIGLFAQTLSPGTPCRAGEEVDFFFRLLKADFSIVYNPRAMVWHDHRRKMSQLSRLIFNYGVSTGSFSTRWLLKEKGWRALYYLWRWNVLGLTFHALRGRTGYPTGLLLREVAGVMAGPAYYMASCATQAYLDRRMRRLSDESADNGA